MRSPKNDIALIGAAGVWNGDRDPLLAAVTLLLMYAKGRHKPTLNLHNLANAIERGDEAKARKCYDRLVQEVERTLTKYPDIVGTIETMSEMDDETLAQIDRLME